MGVKSAGGVNGYTPVGVLTRPLEGSKEPLAAPKQAALSGPQSQLPALPGDGYLAQAAACHCFLFPCMKNPLIGVSTRTTGHNLSIKCCSPQYTDAPAMFVLLVALVRQYLRLQPAR